MNETSQLDIMQELANEGRDAVMEVFKEEMKPLLDKIIEINEKIGREAIRELHQLESEV